MTMRLSRPFAIILFLLLTVVVSGNAQIKIHGRITDANNDPVEFATVRIGGTAIGATAGLDGDYSLTAPKSDTITVFFS